MVSNIKRGGPNWKIRMKQGQLKFLRVIQRDSQLQIFLKN